MKRKIRLIIILATIILLFGAYVFLSNPYSTSFSPKQNELETCKTIKEGSPTGLNILFFADKETTEEYAYTLLETEPMSQEKEKFNIFYIDGYSPECEIYKGQALLCYNEEIIKKAGSCPHDLLVIIKEKDKAIRSSAYMNVMSLNKNHPLTVLAHEFGHAFANLAEEYVPAQIPKGSENCVEDCSSFGEFKEGCFVGCSNTEYFRSIDAGIMRTLTSNRYGIFNEKTILNKLQDYSATTPTITGNAIEGKEDCTKSQYYLVKGKQINGEIIITQITLEVGCPGGTGEGAYSYKIISKGKEVKTNNFNPEHIFTTNPANMSEGTTYTSDIEFIIAIPILEIYQAMEIEKQGEEAKKISIQSSEKQVQTSYKRNSEYTLEIETPGILQSIKVTGTIEGEGKVRIYSEGLLILDNTQFIESVITGNAVSEQQVAITPASPSEDQSIYVQKENDTGENITQEPDSQEETEFVEVEYDGSPEMGTQEKITSITKFEQYCEQTCNLGSQELNKTSYTIKIEVENAKLNLEKITYTTVTY